MTDRDQLPIVCDLSALTDAERRQVATLAEEVFGLADRVEVIHDGIVEGYDVGFSVATTDLLTKIGEFIAYDHRCCAFLDHALIADAGAESVHLRLTGPEGSVAALRNDVAALLPPDVAAAAGVTAA